MRWRLLALFALSPSLVFAGAISLSPTVIGNGGVALLRWEGEEPLVAVARYRDRLINLSPSPGGAAAFLGADVETPEGDYPVEVAVTDRKGRTSFYNFRLTVSDVERPVERLTLPPAMVTPKDPAILGRIERESILLKELFAGVTSKDFPETIRLPVADPVGSVFGLRRILNSQPRSPHSGVDFRSPSGTPVRAPANGKVVYTGDLYYTGKTVLLDHGEGFFTLYAHLDRITVSVGELLPAGKVLGKVGSTGRSTGAHLHWGGKLRGDRIDPLALYDLWHRKNLDSAHSGRR